MDRPEAPGARQAAARKSWKSYLLYRAASGGEPPPETGCAMSYRTLIPASELAKHVDDARWVIVDCRFTLSEPERGREDYFRSHIPGAVYAHLDRDLSGAAVPGKTGRHPLPSPERAAERFGSWGISDGVQVVAYDDGSGGIAARLWWMLRYLGHDDAAVLDGGWGAWIEEERPVASGAEVNPARSFSARVREHWIVDAERVDAIRRDEDWKLLDAREAGRFHGEEEPIDPIAGHIPGARSAPFMENLDASGRFLSREALRGRFGEIIGTTPPERVVSHCGSGVTACHNILALEHAGLAGSLLYPGSWSEWITEEEREVA